MINTDDSKKPTPPGPNGSDATRQEPTAQTTPDNQAVPDDRAARSDDPSTGIEADLDPVAQQTLSNDPVAGETVLPGIEGRDTDSVDRGVGGVGSNAGRVDSTGTIDDQSDGIAVDAAIDPRESGDESGGRLAETTEATRPIYADNDLAGEEIDLDETPGNPRRADTDLPAEHAPEGLAGYDASDDNEALPDFDEGEHGVRGADGPDEDSINISESDGPDLQRDH